LASNSVAGSNRPLQSGIVHIVVTNSELETNPITGVSTVSCDPTDDGDTDTPYHFAPEASMRGWITHSLNRFNAGAVGETEMALTGEPDSDYAGAPLPNPNNRSLASQCTTTQRTGADSGPRGICTCPTPVEGN
jgi:hypothetical protein